MSNANYTREERVKLFRLKACGLSNAEVGKILGRTEDAVKMQVYHVDDVFKLDDDKHLTPKMYKETIICATIGGYLK